MTVLANEEAEFLLLGSLMVTPGAFDRVADMIASDDFALGFHARMFEIIAREVAAGHPVNPMAMRTFVQGDPEMEALGGVPYLARLTGNPLISMFPLEETAHQLRELAERRRMMAGLATAADACADMNIPTSEIIAHADAAISTERDQGISEVTGGQAFDELIRSFDDKMPGVQCQVIPELDELLGSIRPKQLVIAAGRPGMGKTALALSYALGAAEAGHGVLYVSLEMSATELAARMASDLCFQGEGRGVFYSNIRDGDLLPWQALEVRKAQAKAHNLPFAVVDAGSLTIGKLNRIVRRHARRFVAMGYKLELVVVDYLQLMSPDSKGRSAYEAVSEVSRGLKAMAKDNGIGIMALAQLSRSVETRPDKRPQLSDLRDSGQIEQDADAVLFLRREEYYQKQDEPDELDPTYVNWKMKMDEVKGDIEFILAKRRNGETGNALGRFHGAYQAVRGRV